MPAASPGKYHDFVQVKGKTSWDVKREKHSQRLTAGLDLYHT